MPTLTIVLPEELAGRLRRTVRERYSGRKGAISGIITEALEVYLGRSSLTSQSETFRALKRRSIISEASSLAELGKQLRDKGVNPRELRIVSSKTLAPVAKAGFRARAA